MGEDKDLKVRIFILIACFGFFLFTQYESFIDPYTFTDDVMQHTYWMDKFHDPSLFPNDIYVAYSRFLRPYGLKFLYYLLTFIFDPLFAGKILGGILFLISCYLLLKIGTSWRGPLFASLCILFFITNYTAMVMFPGGLGRSFCYPILLAFVLGLLNNNPKLLALTLILGPLFYPLLLPLCLGLLLIFESLPLTPKSKSLNKKIILGAGCLSFLIILSKVIWKPEFLGPLLTKKEMLSNPIFYPGGRSSYFPFKPLWLYIRNCLCPNPLEFLLIIVGLSSFYKKETTLLRLSLSLLLTAFIFYELAKFFFIKLYIPDRYPLYLFPLLRAMLLAEGTIFLAGIFRNRWLKISLPFLISIAVLLFFENRTRKNVGLVSLHKEAREICEFFKKKPKDIMIASPPHLGDYISTFSKRKVLLKYELTQAWFKGYFKIVSERTLDFFKAYYSDDPKELRNFLGKYKIDYLVVDLPYFNPKFIQGGRIYIEPFNKEILKYLEGKREFILLEYLDRAEFKSRNNRYFVIPSSLLPHP